MRSVLQGCSPRDVPCIEVRPQGHQRVYGIQEAAAWKMAFQVSPRVIRESGLVMVRRADW